MKQLTTDFHKCFLSTCPLSPPLPPLEPNPGALNLNLAEPMFLPLVLATTFDSTGETQFAKQFGQVGADFLDTTGNYFVTAIDGHVQQDSRLDITVGPKTAIDMVLTDGITVTCGCQGNVILFVETEGTVAGTVAGTVTSRSVHAGKSEVVLDDARVQAPGRYSFEQNTGYEDVQTTHDLVRQTSNVAVVCAEQREDFTGSKRELVLDALIASENSGQVEVLSELLDLGQRPQLLGDALCFS
ncbi:hypothetical protein TWF225_009778 [Orbilia oligospora]|nr:hypothetical protein TWF225_009778 [Orbilia oligospora]KAF3257822.1 hypothetical protein TWF217_005926 [Orbilia oligospora]KAF3278042.1 hypothetical protein TWF132_001299 [Orbilia oligospora]